MPSCWRRLPESSGDRLQGGYEAKGRNYSLRWPRGVAEKAAQLSEEDMELSEFLGQVLEHARQVLEQTPEMLPVLKEAGVVDSGGQGLVTVLEGACDAFLGKEIPLDFSVLSTEKKPAEISGSVPLG